MAYSFILNVFNLELFIRVICAFNSINGKLVEDITKWSSVCSLQSYYGRHYCTVTLIDQNWAITTDYCYGINKKNFQIICGVTDLNEDNPERKRATVLEVHYRSMDEGELSAGFNLIKIKWDNVDDLKELSFAPLALDKTMRLDWKDCVMLSWVTDIACVDVATNYECEYWLQKGHCKKYEYHMQTNCRKHCKFCDPTIKRSDKKELKIATVSALPYGSCSKRFGYGYIGRKHVCTLNREGTGEGSFFSDDGGPLFCYDKGQHFLAGIQLWHQKDYDFVYLPSVSTQIAPFRNYIENVTKINQIE